MPKPFNVRSLVGSLLSSLIAAAGAHAATVDLPRFPALSPDGREVVFTWRGDLWKAPSAGGAAIRLTSHPADDLRPAWSADGQLIAFESDRDGYRNLYVMRPDGSSIQQVTRLDAALTLVGFGTGPDGKPALLFDASLEGDLYRSARPYRIGLSGGTPVRVHDAFGTFPQFDAGGSKVLFERGGSAWFRRKYQGPDQRDVWLFDMADGSFRRLTEWSGNDGMARWISDREIVFLSDRTSATGGSGQTCGAINLFRMDIASGSTPVQLTDFSESDIHWMTVAGDGKRAIVANWDALYAVDLAAGKPNATKLTFTATEDGLDDLQRKSVAREASELAISPDGQSAAIVAFGDVWVRGTADKSVPRRITDGIGRERDVAWSADGLTLYFVSDKEGGEAIYAATVDKTRSEIKERTEERLAPPKEEKPAEPAPDSPKPAEPEAEKQAPEKGDEKAKEPEGGQGDGDDKDAAKKDAGEKGKKKKDPALDPARWADAMTFHVVPLLPEPGIDTRPTPSPDGKSLLFRRGNGDIMHLDLASKAVRLVAPGFDTDVEFRWSPDSKLIAYTMDDRNFNSDVWLVPADGSAAARNITRHPDSDRSPRFSADGKVLAFLSERTNEEQDVWSVFLEADLEVLAGKDLDQYYKDAAEAVKKRKPPEPAAAKAGTEEPKPPTPEEKPAEQPQEEAKQASPFGDLDLDDAYMRVRRVTTLPGNEGNLELLPAGDKLIFSGAEGTARSLYTIKTDGTGLQKIGSAASVQGLNFDGSRVALISGGVAQSMTVTGSDTKTYDIGETIDVDLALFARQKFLEAARVVGQVFYAPDMKGLDWSNETSRYLALAERTRTSEEFDWVANRLLGELNASHLGVRSPGEPSPLRQAQGRLGAKTKPVEGGFEVVEIIGFTPAALAKRPLLVGDVITAIDFTPFGVGDTIEAMLASKVGKEVVVTVRRPVAGGDPLTLDLLITAIGSGDFARAMYEHNTLRNRQLVEEWSGGKLGYIHIRGMDQPSLNDFERDLYASAEGKAGLIIDVRNNGGGFTADLLLASIMAKTHAYTIPRGGDQSWRDGYPQDRLYIQRYTMPINMLCNEKSFSNAEIISHAFKTLGRGTLVGQQTYGGVISTGGTSLLDGTTVRLPFRGWYLPDGRDMELNGAVPDLVVPQRPEDESKGEDAQLKAAVEDLLKQIS